MSKVTNVAFLIQCDRCNGSGQMHIGKVDFDCILCNAHGHKIQVVTKSRMRKYLEFNDVRSGGGITIQREEARV